MIADSQTIIDHILTNDNESVITPGVFLYKLADHYAIYCSITNPKFKNTNIRNTYASGLVRGGAGGYKVPGPVEGPRSYRIFL